MSVILRGSDNLDSATIFEQNDIGDINNAVYKAASGTADAIILTSTFPLTAYAVGDQFRFRATATNTGAATVNVDGLGIKTLKTITGVDLPAGYIRTDVDTTITYDGVNFLTKRESGDSVTGTATFTNVDNNINLIGIGSLYDLEVGDVIQISGSISNSSEFTVEDITDANNVVVNYEHRGGTTSKSLVDEASTAGVTVELLCKRYNAPVGLGQGWVSMLGSRSFATTYTNNTGRTIQVSSVSTAASGLTSNFLFVDGVNIGVNSADRSGPTYSGNIGDVPGGSDYEFTSSGGNTLYLWSELR